MAEFDKARFGRFLRRNVAPAQFGVGQCARYVRLALADAGLVPARHPVSAKDWGPTLESLGFAATDSDGTDARLGDVVVIQPPRGERHGHIAGFDGTHWISDFVQMRGLYPGPAYRVEQPAFVIYRR
jgi:hypothetical protein